MDRIIKISILAENTARGTGILGEHGFSLWIEAGGKSILFDTGQGIAMEHNARQLGINLASADALVLSHGHYDHFGGLSAVLDAAGDMRLYIHPAALRERFSIRDGQARQIGMPPPVRRRIEQRQKDIVWTETPTEIFPGIHITGSIPRRNNYEDTGGPFFLDKSGLRPDPIEDDQALWIEVAGGLLVVLGCAHSGVINTLDYIHELSGGAPVHTLIGGMHMGSASEARISRTIETLDRLQIANLYPCHCTGAQATAEMYCALKERVNFCSSGMVIADKLA